MNSVSRLATMGEMAAGISHELNQPLAAIANYAQACVRLLRLPAADMPEISGALEQIAGQALRAGEIIRRIRSLVRNEDVRRETQDINELIRDVHGAARERCARARRAAGARSRASPLPRVTVDGVQIQQVLMNLVHNAFEAQGARTRRRALRSAHRHAAHRRGRRRGIGQRPGSRPRGRGGAEDLRTVLHHQGDRAPDSASRSADPSSRRMTRGSGIAPTSRAAHASISFFRRIRRHRHERHCRKPCSWSTTTTRYATRCGCC